MSARRSRTIRTALATAALALAAVAIAAPAQATPPTAPTAPAPSRTSATPVAAPGGSYVPLTPTRVLDTRIGLGAPTGPVTGLTLAIAGHAGVPTTGAAAVVLNLTVTNPAGDGWAAIAPSRGGSLTSNVDYRAGETVAALANSELAVDGTVAITSLARTDLVADVVGYFTTADAAATGDTYWPMTPQRLYDSRVAGGALVGGQARQVRVAGVDGVPSGAVAVVLNTTIVSPDQAVFASAWAGGPWPGTSSINVARGEIRANRTIVPVGPGGTVEYLVNQGRADLVVDVSGYLLDRPGTSAGGAYYLPEAPVRLVDTRIGLGPVDSGNIYFNSPATIGLAGRAGLPRATAITRPVAAWTTLTAVPGVYRHGWVAMYPTTDAPAAPAHPTGTSDLDFDADPVPNAVLATLGVNGNSDIDYRETDLFGSGPFVRGEYVLDVSGTFVLPAAVPPAGLWSRGGVLGDGNVVFGPASTVPSAILSPPGRVTAIVGTGDFFVVLTDDGVVWVAFADGGAFQRATSGAVALSSAGPAGAFIVKRDGTVWATADTGNDGTGLDGYGGGAAPDALVFPVPGATGVRSVSSNGGTAEAVTVSGTVLRWGATPDGTDVQTVEPVPGSAHVAQLALDGAREDGRCTLATDGSALAEATAYEPAGASARFAGPFSDVLRSQDRCWARRADGSLAELDDDGTLTERTEVPPITTMTDDPTGTRGFQGPVPIQVLTTSGTVWTLGHRVAATPVYGLSSVTVIGSGYVNAFAYVPPA